MGEPLSLDIGGHLEAGHASPGVSGPPDSSSYALEASEHSELLEPGHTHRLGTPTSSPARGGTEATILKPLGPRGSTRALMRR